MFDLDGNSMVELVFKKGFKSINLDLAKTKAERVELL